jgi:hypothetical protein
MGFESLRRHPDSGIFLLRKRVPERLKHIVGKREIKISLGTTDRKRLRITRFMLLTPSGKTEPCLKRGPNQRRSVLRMVGQGITSRCIWITPSSRVLRFARR